MLEEVLEQTRKQFHLLTDDLSSADGERKLRY
jgi:hypothetical protein